MFDSAVDMTFLSVENTIVYGKAMWDKSSGLELLKLQAFQNNCVYQTDYPGKLINNYTGTELWGSALAETLVGSTILVNPLFTDGSGNLNTLADAVLQSGSPCRYENITQPTNPLYDPNKREFPTMGAWTYYEIPVISSSSSSSSESSASSASSSSSSSSSDSSASSESSASSSSSSSSAGILIKTPVISGVNNTNGTATITLTETDATQTNTFKYAEDSTTSSFSSFATITGNGTAALKAGSGVFYITANSVKGSNTCVSNIIRLNVTSIDGGTVFLSEEEAYIRDEGELITVQKNTPTTNELGARVNSYSTQDTMWGWRQPLSSSERQSFAERSIYVTEKVFTAQNPYVDEGDRLVFESKTYVVRGTVDQAGRGSLYRINVEEVL